MLIDWFTVVAQLLNFVVLVWLMKRFLYGPILKIVDARDQRVAAALADATEKQLEAKQERDAYALKKADFARAREGLLQKARSDADAEGRRLVAAARAAAEASSTKQTAALHAESEGLTRALSGRVQEEVFAIARKTLADLATAGLEAQVVDAFVLRLRALDDDARGELGTALHAATQPALLRTAFDLPVEQRDAIQTAINETFSMAVPLQFETSPDVVSGVELTAGGQKVAWSISEYLRSLQAGVDALIGDPRTRDDGAAPAEAAPAEAAPAKAAPAEEAAAQHGDG